MKFILPISLVVATVVLIALGLMGVGQAHTAVGIAEGSALPGLTPNPDTPVKALNNTLIQLQRRNWDLAYANISNSSGVDEQAFIQNWRGTDGSLRSFSNLESFETRPMHETSDDAAFRVHLLWSTPVGPVQDVRDFNLARDGNVWKVVWPKIEIPNVPAQVVPVNYLRWDLVTGSSGGEWGAHNIDAPNVRIISMNAVDTAEGTVIMGEAVNQDTVPAFVTVNATLVDGNGNTIDEESSFDKIDHILLPKQVTPYRVDFPSVSLNKVKNVRMDIKATLVPASADPVIGVTDQKLDVDAQGHTVLRGDLMNESGQTVNIPHVIASFYDNNGKVVWVSDGYVQRALLPQSSEPFAVEIPKNLSGKVHNFHVVVNQYSLKS